ncbi:MAG: NAD(P)H-binding protein [Nitriliruptoraceae bacterium]
MARVAVIGAAGFTGHLIVDEACRRGHDVVAVARHPERRPAVLARDSAGSIEARVADVDDAGALRAALEGVDVAISAVGPFVRFGAAVVDAAVDLGIDLVDVAGEQVHLRRLVEDSPRLARAGVRVVSAAGFDSMPGDLLARRAGDAAVEPREVHVTYHVGGPARSRRVSAGTRRSVAEAVGRPSWAFVDGELVDELIAQERRLAWFPRPVGPRHAVGIPGGEPLIVPRYLPTVRTVRTYLAMASWRAEILQALSGATRVAWVRRRVRAHLVQPRADPSTQERASTRWAVVAEASGARGVARGWAHGHDVYGLSAVTAVLAAERVGAAEPGLRSPAELGDAGDLLDELARRSDLRWSLVRPS